MKSTLFSNILLWSLTPLACIAAAGSAKAIDIGTVPFNDTFSWNNPSGPPAAADPSYTINVGSPTSINVALEDCCVVGDVFELLLNGNALAPSSSAFTADGSSSTNPLNGDGLTGGAYFYGIWNNVALAPGLNTFSVNVTTYATNYTNGEGFVYFSNTQTQDVPGPLPVFGAAAAFGYSRRLRRVIRARASHLPKAES